MLLDLNKMMMMPYCMFFCFAVHGTKIQGAAQGSP